MDDDDDRRSSMKMVNYPFVVAVVAIVVRQGSSEISRLVSRSWLPAGF